MPREIEIQELIQYLDKTLPKKRAEEIDLILQCNPYYQKMLEGLSLLREELGEDANLNTFLEEKKKNLKKRIFKKNR